MEAWERRESESNKAYQAFCIYRDMGIKRSLEKVSQELGKSKALLERWSSKYRWIARSEAYDAHLELLARKDKEAEHIRNIEQYRQRQKVLAIKISESAIALLKKADERLKNIDVLEIPAKTIPSFYRAAASIAEAGTNSEAQSLAVDELLAVLKDSDNE